MLDLVEGLGLGELLIVGAVGLFSLHKPVP